MGAIIGGLYASGMKTAELRRFILEELDISSFMESSTFKLSGALGKLFQAGKALGNVTAKPGMDTGAKVLALLEQFSGGKNIEDCAIPFLCNAVDICSGEELVFRSGSLAKAVRASMSFPLVFEPLVDGERCFVDGGVADNMPVKAAREAGAALGIRRVLAVDTRKWRRVPPEYFKNGINVMLRSFDVLVRMLEHNRLDANSRTAGNRSARRRADLVLYAVDKSSAFDFSRKQEILALGEEAVRTSRTELEAFFGGGIGSLLARRRYRDCGIRLDTYYGRDHA
jgi:NTE family protein